jgi:hypothetical protein
VAKGKRYVVQRSYEPITVNVSDRLYRRLMRRAEQTQRTVEAELLDAAASGLPLHDELPLGLEDELQQLVVLTDEALWRVADSRLAQERAGKLERLHRKAQRQPLSTAERKLELELTRQYERAMLLRARAAWLLKERGFDVSALLLPL